LRRFVRCQPDQPRRNILEYLVVRQFEAEAASGIGDGEYARVLVRPAEREVAVARDRVLKAALADEFGAGSGRDQRAHQAGAKQRGAPKKNRGPSGNPCQSGVSSH